MNESKKPFGESTTADKTAKKMTKGQSPISSKAKAKKSIDSEAEDREVLISIGPLKYRTPGKKTRVGLAFVVLGLNVLLVLAVIIYFNNSSFQEFVFNFGRS